MGPFFASQYYMTTQEISHIDEPSFVIYFAGNFFQDNQTLPLNGDPFDISLFPLLNYSLQQNYTYDLKGKTSICISSNHSLGSSGGECISFYIL
jgi:hypothetical protein